MSNTSINVAILGEDELVLGRLAQLIEATEGLRCSGRYGDADSALDECLVAPTDVVLMDITLPGTNGIECVRRIKEACPNQLILVLSNWDEQEVVFSTLSASAIGYLLKPSSPKQITTAIREVYLGGSPMTASIARWVVSLFHRTDASAQGYRKLSLRERQVLDLLAKGFRFKEIVWELKISYATACTHIRHIYRKLRVNSRTDAVTLHLRQCPGWQVGARPPQLVELLNVADGARNFAPAGAL
jgi:DNA-binding NarL/FixJ family response regulator